MSEITNQDLIEAIAEGYSDTEDSNPWESTDNAETIIIEELNHD